MIVYEKSGDVRTFVAPSPGVTSGVPLLIENTIVVPQVDAATDAEFDGVCRGQMLLPKTTGEAWDAGEKLYWVSGTSKFSTTSGGNTLAGVAAADAESAATEGSVYLDGVAR